MIFLHPKSAPHVTWAYMYLTTSSINPPPVGSLNLTKFSRDCSSCTLRILRNAFSKDFIAWLCIMCSFLKWLGFDKTEQFSTVATKSKPTRDWNARRSWTRKQERQWRNAISKMKHYPTPYLTDNVILPTDKADVMYTCLPMIPTERVWCLHENAISTEWMTKEIGANNHRNLWILFQSFFQA